jgi:2-acylglycerol O-acyltransferase 2
MVFFGAFGIPFGQPKPKPITVIVGSPIQVPQTADPTDAQIAKYHDLFLEQVTQIYNEHKGDHGMADVVLRIV